MQLRGEWFHCSDGVVRPVLRGEVRSPSGQWVGERFLVDTGADVTVLGPVVCESLHLDSNGSSNELGGIDGNVRTTIVAAQIQVRRDDGEPVTFQGDFHAILAAQNLEMSVLGRDILEMFALIIDRPGDVVCLLRGKHRYEIHEAM